MGQQMKKTGYRNPPAEHRWQKGQSGNPSGRPKKTSTPQQDIAALLFEPVHVNDQSGRQRTWHIYEFALTNFCKKLLVGSPSAFCRGFETVERLLSEAQIQREEEEAEDPRVLKELKELGYEIVDGECVPIENRESDV